MNGPDILQHLRSLGWGASVYIRTHKTGKVLRFTKLTRDGWKNTDPFSRPGAWIDDKDLAQLGTITTPPWKDKPDDRQANSS